MADERMARLREICARFPGVAEGITVHHPSFTIADKAFLMVTDGGANQSLWMKSNRGAQAELVGSDPEKYFVPPYVGHHGWVGVRAGPGTDWAEVAELVTDAYRAAAPKRLLAQFDAVEAGRPAGPDGAGR